VAIPNRSPKMGVLTSVWCVRQFPNPKTGLEEVSSGLSFRTRNATIADSIFNRRVSLTNFL
jgi:hypothetical protein